jgi:hypothetical protein
MLKIKFIEKQGEGMKANNQGIIVFYLSLPLVILLITVSILGLADPYVYLKETLNWRTQSLGQDIVDLFLISPILLITSILVYKKNQIALLLWSGAILYLIYTFVIYCFAVHFNYLFWVYCIILGLSFYSFVYFILMQLNEPFKNMVNGKTPC